jgi:hypothetical protein
VKMVTMLFSLAVLAYVVGSFITTLHFHRKFNYCQQQLKVTKDERWLQCMRLAHQDTRATFIVGGFWPVTLKRWNVDYMKELSQ